MKVTAAKSTTTAGRLPSRGEDGPPQRANRGHVHLAGHDHHRDRAATVALDPDRDPEVLYMTQERSS